MSDKGFPAGRPGTVWQDALLPGDRLPRGANHQPIGNPVRAPIAAVRNVPFPSMDGELNIVITGGSQGARSLNQWVIHNLPALRAMELSVYCVTGLGKTPGSSAELGLSDSDDCAVKFVSFSDQMGDVISAADLTTLTELYIAYFNRAADALGLSFWATAFQSGLDFAAAKVSRPISAFCLGSVSSPCWFFVRMLSSQCSVASN